MKYYNMYAELKSKEELINMMRRDIKISCFWGMNRKRVNNIKEAGKRICKERGW